MPVIPTSGTEVTKMEQDFGKPPFVSTRAALRDFAIMKRTGDSKADKVVTLSPPMLKRTSHEVKNRNLTSLAEQSIPNLVNHEPFWQPLLHLIFLNVP